MTASLRKASRLNRGPYDITRPDGGDRHPWLVDAPITDLSWGCPFDKTTELWRVLNRICNYSITPIAPMPGLNSLVCGNTTHILGQVKNMLSEYDLEAYMELVNIVKYI